MLGSGLDNWLNQLEAQPCLPSSLDTFVAEQAYAVSEARAYRSYLDFVKKDGACV